jgi:hypothetical protein
MENEAVDLISHGPENAEADLAPNLINAREIHPILNPALSANSTWNPEPNWNTAWGVEQLPRPNVANGATMPIPEAYPLQPRLKNEPPAIGEAFVAFPNIQARPTSSLDGAPTASPFDAQPMPSSKLGKQFVRHEGPVADPSPVIQQPAWPDQTYALDTAKPHDALEQSKPRLQSKDLATPHLLTGLEVRQKPAISQPPPPVASPTSGFSVQPNQPPTGNYILQPMRKQSQ